MSQAFGRSFSLTNKRFTYCPGCGHGIIHRLIAEVIDEMDMREKTIGVGSIGCGGMIYDCLNFDTIVPLHGRAPSVAMGIKRVQEDKLVFTYQGDGDIAAIGTAEIIHAASRGENITAIFVNNGVFGMTGGQMAPTTRIGQVTATTPQGRDAKIHGFPLKLSEMIGVLDGVAYVERTAVCSVKHIMRAKKAIREAFEVQLRGEGFSMVEILTACPTGWRMSPDKSMKHIEDDIIPAVGIGVFKKAE